MRGHIIVSGDDALAMQIVDELNDAEISVVPLKSPMHWSRRTLPAPTR